MSSLGNAKRRAAWSPVSYGPCTAHRPAYPQPLLDGTLAPPHSWLRPPTRVQVLALTTRLDGRSRAAASACGTRESVHSRRGDHLRWRGQELPSWVSAWTLRTPRWSTSGITLVASGARSSPRRGQTTARTEAGRNDIGTACCGMRLCLPTRTWPGRSWRAVSADTVSTAFDRYLGGAQGYVSASWPDLAATVAVIAASGGHAIARASASLQLSGGALRNLCEEFAACGGAALEVSLPGLSPADAERLARLARQHSLAGSAGSDFHEPGLPWRPLGRFARLPEGIEPLLPRLLLVA